MNVAKLAKLCIFISAVTLMCAKHVAADDSPRQETTPLILISIDGFRWDYIDRGKTPVLQELREKGGYAKIMTPSFPSLTFPNHYTLVTGLRPDQHGIVANTMEDPEIKGVRFSMGNKQAVTDARWWNQAKPIWVSAEQQGLPTATMFWPGSEAAIHEIRPSEWRPFDGKLSAKARVEILLNWLDKPKGERPVFSTLYFDDVDHAGHDFGPDSPELEQALGTINEALQVLLKGIKQRNFVANLVIVSDHGMAATSMDRVVYLNQYIPLASINLITYGAVAGFSLKSNQDHSKVKAILGEHEHMRCFEKAHFPQKFEFGNNPRVPEITCVAEPGWLISSEYKPGVKPMLGTHGYDNLAKEMGALFVVNGPGFRPGASVDRLDNVDVYPMIMHLLNLRAEPSRGQLEASRSLLNNP